jgi:hypothetical protein
MMRRVQWAVTRPDFPRISQDDPRGRAYDRDGTRISKADHETA